MHSARLLITFLYLTPIAAIILHTLSERLPRYHRIHFSELTGFYQSESKEQQQHYKNLDFPTLDPGLQKFQSFVGDITSWVTQSLQIIQVVMSTRYWDEIDWYIQEGTQKLCEMLNSENENEDASSSKWSTGEEEDDTTKRTIEGEKTQNDDDRKTEITTKKFDDMSLLKDEVSDGDSVKDEEDYIERSTSVEDENPSIIKKQTKVDELLSMCTQCGMLPPIYTYFTTGDEQVVSTVQLWNSVRFSSHPQMTRDKAMDEAAGHALGYLKGELSENRPVSTSPPSTLPYYVPVHNLVQPQYYAQHAAYEKQKFLIARRTALSHEPAGPLHNYRAGRNQASPVSYASASAQPYFMPSVPYTMIPPAPMVTIGSDYQQAAIIHPQYRISPQYTPFIQQYPLVQYHVSPTHQPKGSTTYHGSAAKPVMWSAYSKEPYLVQDKANAPRTEFKLLDEPPVSSNSKQTDNYRSAESSTPKKNNGKSGGETKSNAQKKQPAAKPKLAISFNKDKKSD